MSIISCEQQAVNSADAARDLTALGIQPAELVSRYARLVETATLPITMMRGRIAQMAFSVGMNAHLGQLLQPRGV